MHKDLKDQMGKGFTEMMRGFTEIKVLLGVVPDETETQPPSKETYTLPIPENLVDAFERQAIAHGQTTPADSLALQQLVDGFLMWFPTSTVGFTPGRTVQDRIPPENQYLNLLKCGWILERIKTSEELEGPCAESHWPSFVSKLEDVSISCP